MIVLPARPNLEQLKKQAKELLQAHQAAEPEAIRYFADWHPGKTAKSFALHDAQLVLARQYGFASWMKLKEEVDRLCGDFDARLHRFVCDAADGDFLRAKRALSREPELATGSFWAALVLGDLPAIRRTIERDASQVHRSNGPQPQWTPLHYVCFSRFQGEGSAAAERFTDCARLLLDAGADANASFESPLWPDAPMKSLYGATGVNNNPALARLLLSHDAELNDGESIYHAAQLDHRESMEVLRAAGVSLGLHPRWKNTPLYFLVGSLLASAAWPATKRGIRWLLDHGSDPNAPCGPHLETTLHGAIRGNHEHEIVRWLLECEADPNRPDQHGILPLTLAHRVGRSDLVKLLREFGAYEVPLTLKEQFFEAVFSGRAAEAAKILRTNPELSPSFDEEDRLTLNRATERGQTEAVGILLDCGFDISFKGTREWSSTPLHTACWHGQTATVDLLLARGAPVDIPANPPEASLPLGWAAHGSSHCRNPQGDYPHIVRALLSAGAIPHITQAEMASLEVADVIHAALAGKEI